MKIVLAPDSFKECMPSPQVAAALAAAVRQHWPMAQVVEIPLADGGEGTLEVLAKATDASCRTVTVCDPLGRPVQAQFAIMGKTAIIESAQAIGLSLLSPPERNPLKASSRGVGELLLTAYHQGARHFIIGLGGSATCDGGEGLMWIPEMNGCTFELLCDVDAPFVGPKGAARLFAPQKGATAQDVEVLEQRMIRQEQALYERTGVHVATLPGAGAAGGLGGAFMALFNARPVRGIDRVLDLVRFVERTRGADLIITGEGKSDAQTLMGKVPFGVLQHAHGIPVALLSGRIEDCSELEQAGFRPVVEVTPRTLSLSQALLPKTTRSLLSQAVMKMLWEPPVTGK